MSNQLVITYSVQGNSILRNCHQTTADGAAQCNRLACILSILCQPERTASQMASADGPFIKWTAVDDLVNPFGDTRGDHVSSVWTVDADEKTVSLLTKDDFRVASLSSLDMRSLSLADLETTNPPAPLLDAEQTSSAPYWEPDLAVPIRKKAFLEPLLRDFGHSWRHIFRWRMNNTTFLKLAYATIWLLTMNFTLYDLQVPEYATTEETHISVTELPRWQAPTETVVKIGASWFVLARNVHQGVDMVRDHLRANSKFGVSIRKSAKYVILTLHRVVLCNADEAGLTWTRPEALFGGDAVSDASIQMLIWGVTPESSDSPTALSRLPVEIQDRIMFYGGTSFVASARLGCKLGLGSRFAWIERGVKIAFLEQKKIRTAFSPVESRILFGGFKSGLVYQREQEYTFAESMSALPASSGTTPSFHCRFFQGDTFNL